MVPVEDLFCRRQVEAVLGFDIPRQGKTGVEIITHHRRLMRPGGHFGELVAFLEKLILNLPREAEAFDLLTQLVRFFQRIIAVSELRRDGTHLLPQIILPLIAVDGFVYLLLDILLQFQDIGLPREHRQQGPTRFQPRQR